MASPGAFPVGAIADTTPTASAYGSNQGGSAGRVGPVRLSLQSMATRAMWPTPVVPSGGRSIPPAAEWRGKVPYHNGKKVQVDLGQAVKWQTPTVQDAKGRDRHNQKNGTTLPSLLGQARMWPTPQARDGDEKRGMLSKALAESRLAHGRSNLDDAVSARMFPTPTTQDATNNGAAWQAIRNTPPLNAVVGAALNPTWVELLMGWPRNWTMVPPLGPMDGKTERRARSVRKKSATDPRASRPSATAKSRSALRSLGGC